MGYLNTAMGPGYYDNRYWSLYKLPMFGCTDSYEVIKAIETCKREMPMAKVRVIGFDSQKQVKQQDSLWPSDLTFSFSLQDLRKVANGRAQYTVSLPPPRKRFGGT